MILRDARLPGDQQPVDLTIEGGLLVEARPRAGAPGPELDLDGRWVVRGLWDEHVHMSQWAQRRQRIDLSDAASAAEAARIVAEAPRPAQDLPIVGGGYRDGLWPDPPSARVLDEVEPLRPVALIGSDLHSCWLNTAALRRFGFGDHPTGVLLEEDCFRVIGELSQVPETVLDHWVEEAAAAAAARGVVGVVDLEMAWNAGDWQRRYGRGFDRLRVDCGIYPQHLERAIAAGWRSGTSLNPLLTVGPMKIITDGSLNTRTAYCADPYPDGSHGVLTVPPPELAHWIGSAHDAGFTVAVHAIGDEANRLALDAFAATGAQGRIEHAQLVGESDFVRFAGLGVVASVQPEHAMDDRDVAQRYWPGRTGRAYPYRSMLDAGVTMVFGSDAPVAPLDPWASMDAAVTR